ncbi:collagen alpha-1(XII) chain-like [Mytilus trossulus]|uniref:collagen alpha-1(XII) chain-like n=1 Tax=Mytilus trossulus TaxID=6551 RepID=UPI0030077168
MVGRIDLLVIVLVFMIGSNHCFLFTKEKVDCQMSQWSEWSEVYGFGARSKERVILRHPDNGGKPCPTDTDITEYTSRKPTIQSTANTVITSFLQKKIKTNSTTSQGTVKAKVPGVFRDLLIILDSSTSIGSGNFEIVKEQLGELLGLLCPSTDPFISNKRTVYNRAALIQYSNNVVEEFDFNDNHNLAELKAAIQSVPYKGGVTCTGDAFYKAIQMFTSSKGMRQGTKHEVLILSDGVSNCGRTLSSVLPMLHAKATVFGLMIGGHSEKGKDELTSYVSQPKPDHLFAVKDFQVLKELLKAIKDQIDKTNPCAPFELSKK